MLKLEKELLEVVKRLEVLKQHSNVLEYKEKLKASRKYNCFEV